MKILIIEDEKDISAFLKKNLEIKYFAVDCAEDGEIGTQMALSKAFDLIILDNVLPKKYGKEVCRDIRAAGKSVPILMFSVKSTISDKVELLNAGADDYLIKPFSFEELLARVNALLRRPKVTQNQTITLGDVKLDSSKQEVLRSGKSLRLTRKEFMLLEYLMKSSGIVLSRAMIMEQVWDMNTDPFSNTIESHVLSLRKKLGSEGTKKLILTIPGRGYKFEPQ